MLFPGHSVPKVTTTRDNLLHSSPNEAPPHRQERRGITPHEVIRTPHDTVQRGTMAARDPTMRGVPTRDHISRDNVPPRDHLSREHLPRGSKDNTSQRDEVWRSGGPSHESPTKQRALASIRKSENRTSNISPNSEGKKRLKQTRFV